MSAEIVVGGAASIITARSPYIVRTMYAQIQVTVPMAQWAARNGIKRVVTLVSDYSPGLDAEKAFIDEFKADGGEIVEAVRGYRCKTQTMPLTFSGPATPS